MFWLVTLSLFITGQTKWLDIPRHDEKIYLDKQKLVANFEDVRDKCKEMSAIPLVLWNPLVLDFVANYLVEG